MATLEYKYDKGTCSFSFTDKALGTFLKGTMPEFPSDFVPEKQIHGVHALRTFNETVSVSFGEYATLEISPVQTNDKKASNGDKKSGAQTIGLTLKSTSADYVPEIRFDIKSALWYGGSELYEQKWPLENMSLPLHPFLPSDFCFRPEHRLTSGPVQERYWIDSKGVGIFVDRNVPLHMSWNDEGNETFCLRANFEGSRYETSRRGFPSLSIKICKADDIKATHLAFSRLCFDKPEGMPDERMIRSPVWSTWAQYKTSVNQEKVLKFANRILEHGFSNSQLEIDDMYSTSYGDFDFSSDKFPSAKDMIAELKTKGFRVTVWVTPFANPDSSVFKEGTEKGYWIADTRGVSPAVVKWWQGFGAVLDVTNPEAVTWFTQRLKKMQKEYGVDSFKFDAGEVTFLPRHFKTFSPIESPGDYTAAFVKLVASFGGMVEARVSFGTQKYPIFLRLNDKQSKWGVDNGLKALIPAVLTMGLLGYPYVLPDMIGGNAYADLPSKELYIRWMQVTAYLPSMQFSITPWQFDEEVVQVAKKFIAIHEEVVTPLLLEAAKETQKNGSPLIRPLWWVAPKDDDALRIDSEFLVGDSLLVAPVLEEGALERDIYIPEGRWEDVRQGDKITGKRWLKNYKVDLSEVATFRKLSTK